MAVEPVLNPKGEVQLQSTKNDQLVLSRRNLDYLRDAMNLGTVIVENICLLVAPYYFTWNAFWGFWALTFLTQYIGISLSYHRNLSHKSFKLPKSLEYLFAYFGLHAAQGDPIFWVSIHRYHHQFTDSDRDPHSPIEGFWFSHMTWIFQHTRLREKGGKRNNVMDLQNQAYYRFLRTTYPLHIVGLALVLYFAGGLPHLIWGMGFRTALGTHFTFAVNSVCHTWGKRPWNTKDLSKNNWVVNILGHGEGWHNNHHAFEFSARLGLEWWQIDVPWYVIKLLEHFGLATDVKQVVSEKKGDFWNRVNLGTLIVEHVAVLFAPFYFTWNAFWVAVILYLVTLNLGLSLSYHRNLTHKSLKLKKPLEYLFAYIGLHCAQGDPMFWVSNHRYHHQFTDSVKDPHSPVEGFWFSHIGWALHNNYLREKVGKSNNVMDLKKQAYYRFLRRTHLLHLLGLALLLYVFGGLPHLIWGMGVRIAAVQHSTFIVNSLCHTWGERPWNTEDLSKNNWVVGLLGFGEGWHNNHHAFQFSARVGLEWWQLDIPWYIIKLLEHLGLATNVKVPTEMQKLKLSSKVHNASP
ncbi:hypothetical protein MKX03_023683 [Papaver bracteatum]|nr:hypothetical protein MKX03_023683 [Papaver bracteatum]